MIDESIKNFRNAIFSLAILSVFLVLVIKDMSAKVDATIKLEQKAISYQLMNESAKDLIIPNIEGGSKYIRLSDAGYSYMGMGLALAHINYAFPLWFGEQYCPEESQGKSKIIFNWLSWEVTVSPNECIYQPPVNVITLQLDTEKIIPQRLALLSPKIVRVPYDDLDKYKDVELETYVSLDTSLFNCLTVADTPDYEYSLQCKLENAEKIDAELNYLQHVGKRNQSALFREVLSAIKQSPVSEEEYTEVESNLWEKGDGPYFATLQVLVKHKQTKREYILAIDNVGKLKNRYDFDDVKYQIVGWPNISAPWFKEKQSPKDILFTLRELYTESTGNFKHEVTETELINWVQKQVLNITNGKVEAPFIGTPVPLSALLLIVLLIYGVLLAWTYHLSRVINELTYDSIEVPWMLLLFKNRTEKKGLLLYIDLILASCLLLVRVILILLPSVVIFVLSIRGDAISSYFLPNPDFKYIILIALTPLFLLATTIIYIEITTIKKLISS